jgi:hypothetical protein
MLTCEKRPNTFVIRSGWTCIWRATRAISPRTTPRGCWLTFGSVSSLVSFLALINNEIKAKDDSYKDNLRGLTNLVMLQFTNETTVVPAVSSHFGSLRPLPVNAAGGNPSHQIIPLRESQLYLEDWIGLKALDEAGKLSFGWCEGEHMQFSLDDAGGCWDKAVRRWVGSDRRGQ